MAALIISAALRVPEYLLACQCLEGTTVPSNLTVGPGLRRLKACMACPHYAYLRAGRIVTVHTVMVEFLNCVLFLILALVRKLYTITNNTATAIETTRYSVVCFVCVNCIPLQTILLLPLRLPGTLWYVLSCLQPSI